MMFITALSTALVAGVAVAQQASGVPAASYNSSVVSSIANELSAATKTAWCNSQSRACQVLCNSQATNNSCDPTTLDYSCTCASNNSAPAFQYYNPTMVTNECNQYLGDCLAQNANHADLQAACQSEIVCGNSSIDAYASQSHSASTASSTSSSATGSATGTATSSSASTSASAKSGAVALEFNPHIMTGVFGAALIGAFGFAL